MADALETTGETLRKLRDMGGFSADVADAHPDNAEERQKTTDDEEKNLAVGDMRHDAIGRMMLMAHVENYCMVRRPGAAPFVLSVRDWMKLSPVPLPGGLGGPRASVYGVRA